MENLNLAKFAYGFRLEPIFDTAPSCIKCGQKSSKIINRIASFV